MSRNVVYELAGAALLVLLGAGFALGGAAYGITNEEGRIGTGFLPFVSGGLMVVFGLAVAVETLLAARRADSADPGDLEGDILALALAGDDEVAGPAAEGQGRSVALVFALTLVAVVAIPFAGFLVSFAVLLFVLVTWVEREGARRGLAVSLVGVVAVYLIFQVFLKVPLPGGYPGLWLGF